MVKKIKRTINKKPPIIENKLYPADTEQARYLRSLCAQVGNLPLAFGHKIYKTTLEKIRGYIKSDDVQGLVLGFHAKAIDQLIGVRMLANAGLISPSIGLIRGLFEAHVYQKYILKEDTENRANAYREYCSLERERVAKQLQEKGDTSEPTMRILKHAEQRPKDKSETVMCYKGIQKLAKEMDLEKLYVSLYCAACEVTHAKDIDSYNPIIQYILINQPLIEEPCFLTSSSYSICAASDVFAIMFFAEFVPWCHFGNTAEYFDIPIDKVEKESIDAARIATSSGRTRLTSSFAEIIKEYPELFFR